MKPHSISQAEQAVEFHRQAVDQALRQALGTSQPALRRQSLRDLEEHLIHPRLILESPLLADSHVWRQEALIISDAFEAVTNGMEEPQVLDALDTLQADSPFQPWRHGILALHFYYEGLDEAVRAHLAQISPRSPVTALAAVVEGLVSGQVQRLPPAQRNLAEEVARPDPVLLQCVQDVSEGLEADDEGLFWQGLGDWLEAVSVWQPERAKAAYRWAWVQLEWRDFDETILFDQGVGLWGRPETYRLAALGTSGWDPEGAALLWLRFLLSSVREGDRDRASLGEALVLLKRFQAAVESPSAEWPLLWHNLSLAWNAEVSARGWKELSLGLEAPPAPFVSVQPAADGQLDLFS